MLKSLKIAVIHNLPSGGAKRALQEFCRGLHQQQHHLDLYIPALANEEFLPLTDYVQNTFTFPILRFRLWQTRLLPFVIQYLNLPRKLTYLHTLKHIYARMAQAIDQKGYDVAFVHHCQVVQSPYILRYLQTPSLYYCQEPPRRLYEPSLVRQEEKRLKQKIQNTWYAPVNRFYQHKMKQDDFVNTRSATLVLANSFYSRESIYRTYGINARVNYLGVDIDRFNIRKELQKEHVVLSVGRTYPEKGYEFIIQALARIPATLRPRLVILADMSDKTEERFLSQLAQQKNVAFTVQNVFCDDALVKWYNTAKVLVYGAYLEPLGLAPLEAMACGTPVVAVKEGGVRETVVDGETGFLTQRDPQEFAEKVQFLLENPDVRIQYGHQARQYVENTWTWERSVRELVRNLHNIRRA